MVISRSRLGHNPVFLNGKDKPADNLKTADCFKLQAEYEYE